MQIARTSLRTLGLRALSAIILLHLLHLPTSKARGLEAVGTGGVAEQRQGWVRGCSPRRMHGGGLDPSAVRETATGPFSARQAEHATSTCLCLSPPSAGGRLKDGGHTLGLARPVLGGGGVSVRAGCPVPVVPHARSMEALQASRQGDVGSIPTTAEPSKEIS